MSAASTLPAGAVDALETVATRLGNLAELLSGLAAATSQRRLQEGALFVAADYANDTHRRLAELVDAIGDEIAQGAAPEARARRHSSHL